MTTTTLERRAEGRPTPAEAAAYYFKYIDRVPGDDVVSVLERQLGETLAALQAVDEKRSLHRYAADKWSAREVLSHVNDGERLFSFRAFWFARGFDSPLPSFDEKTAAAAAHADDVPWSAHVDEFRALRLASLALFKSLAPGSWTKTGVASDNPFSVRALAYICAGHLDHHLAILKDRYFA